MCGSCFLRDEVCQWCSTGALCCHTPYGPYGWRQNFAWAAGCSAFCLTLIALYTSRIGVGRLPNVANPDDWTHGYGLLQPILLVAAFIILPFSVMLCCLYQSRATHEREEGCQRISRQSGVTADEPQARAAFCVTFTLVMGIVGMIITAMGFGRMNGQHYEGAKVVGIVMMVMAAMTFPLAAIFLGVKSYRHWPTTCGCSFEQPASPSVHILGAPQHPAQQVNTTTNHSFQPKDDLPPPYTTLPRSNPIYTTQGQINYVPQGQAAYVSQGEGHIVQLSLPNPGVIVRDLKSGLAKGLFYLGSKVQKL